MPPDPKGEGGHEPRRRSLNLKKTNEMKKALIFSICIVLSVTMMAQPAFRRNTKKTNRVQYNLEEVVSVGDPGQVIKHKGFTLSYNESWLIPNWVAYELTSEEASATTASRTDEFLPDPQVKGRQADTRDYSNSGYDRGHMAAAADMKWDKQAMIESFYLSNTCPQNRELNAGLWLELEQKCRYWAKKYDRVWIVCGPLFTTGHNDPIGYNQVAVPDAFFKCICMQVNDRWTMAAFIFPNLPASGELDRYIFPVVGVEQIAGIQVFNNLPVTAEQLFNLKALTVKNDWMIPGWKKQ